MLTKQILSFTIIAFVFFLTGCSGEHLSSKDLENSAPLLPMNDQLIFSSTDSSDVKTFMQDYFKQVYAPTSSQYDFVTVDLNGDHLKDALVYMKTPYGRWCDMPGCRLIVLQAHLDGFALIGSFERVRPPFYISTKTHNGWNDIAIEDSGRLHEESNIYILRFNGNGYSRPVEQPYTFSRTLIKASLLP